jgi:hypothetical protein
VLGCGCNKTIRYNTSGLWHHVGWLVVSNVTKANIYVHLRVLHHDQAWHKSHEPTVTHLQKFCEGSSIIFTNWQLQDTLQSSVSTGWHVPPVLPNNANKIIWRWMQCVPPKLCYSTAGPAALKLVYVDRFQGVHQLGRGKKQIYFH